MAVMLELLGRGPARPDLWEDLLVTETQVPGMLHRWVRPAPAPREPGGLPLPAAEDVTSCLAAGTPVVVDVSTALPGPARGAADPETARHLADLLVVAAHAGTGFGVGLLPRVACGDQVWSLLSGAVAAMTGADVEAALVNPDAAAIVSLGRSAREAIRDVVTAFVLAEEPVGRGDPVAGRRRWCGPGGRPRSPSPVPCSSPRAVPGPTPAGRRTPARCPATPARPTRSRRARRRRGAGAG